MKIKLQEAADLVGGVVFGNPDLEFFNVAKLEDANFGDLSFLYLDKYEHQLLTTKASAVLISPKFKKVRDDISYIEVKEPNSALNIIIKKYFDPKINLKGIDPTASIHKNATVDESAVIGKNVVISSGCKIGKNSYILHNSVLMDNVEVGDNCIIYSNVSIRENCKIGNNVIIHSNTCIGSDGFGFIPNEKGEYIKVPQIGNVVIEDDVEIGSNVSVDRAALGSTIIKKGTKIDNLVQIAHNVSIGENSILIAQSGIAGSTKLGKNCILAGQVGVTGHIELADNVMITAQSGVSKSIDKAGKYRGSPALPLNEALRQEASIRIIPSLQEKIKKLEEKIAFLENKFSDLSKKEN
ncbi:MAG: UDP-3-O-(3-hydroxymyristoyl)glucosamine N-acyltransferase [Melioribacteraceae bacterium]|nr:UDP-3-O-(3-hydroxymyristoyl)glucosamine N-acyltransferase [Melioribacteraceae bacterium]